MKMVGPRWNRVSNATGVMPKPRHGHRAVAIKELIVIFGGGNEGILADLIVYNTLTSQWFKPTVKGTVPDGRAAHGMVVDKTRIIIFGGMLEFMRCTNDVYELQASRWEWKKLHPRPPLEHKPPPCPRLGHSFTLIGSTVYMFGGICINESNNRSIYLNDLYALQLENSWAYWTIPVTYGKPPSPRESHSAVTHTDSEDKTMLIIYGGMQGARLGDVWTLCISSMTWRKVDVNSPSPLPRSLHTATVVGDKMYVFGGWVPIHANEAKTSLFEKEWKVSNQLLCLDLTTMVWNDLTNFSPNDSPKARSGHAAVEVNGRIYIWSGRDGYRRAWNNQVCCSDLWYLDIDLPPAMSRPQLLKGDLRFLEIQWPAVQSADLYLLQIQKMPMASLSRTHENTLQPSLPLISSSLRNLNQQGSLNRCENSSAETRKPSDSPAIQPSTSLIQPFTPVNENIPRLNHSETSYSEPRRKITISVQKPAQKVQQSDTPPLKPPPPMFTLSMPSKSDGVVASPLVPSTLRPLTTSVLRINNPRMLTDHGPRGFTVSQTGTIVRVPGPPPQTRPPTLIVKNPGLKLVAVNKDSHIKLVPCQGSHLLNKTPTSRGTSILKKIGQKNPQPSLSNEHLDAAIKSVTLSDNEKISEEIQQTVSSVRPLKPPSLSEHVQIKNVRAADGILLSWSPAPNAVVSAYKVALNVGPNIPKIIYNGNRPECFILKSYLDSAHVEENGSVRSVKFTIQAMNSAGQGPPLVVKWVLNPATHYTSVLN